MRTDSCRTCGVEMKEFQRCIVCSEVNRFVCTTCRKQTEEQIHFQCGTLGTQVLLN